ncbi:MAG: aldo/keto reductase [Candidatus Hydrogenedentes bacterium]|nr:aldo/keto reductase [Candidatus Hydrogenedentota bacterium]
MQYRRFGKTEIQIPVISCGGMRFQESWNSGDDVSEESQKNLEATVRRAFELGINHFETARGYGTSEFQLGKILPQLPRDEIIVQTKVGACANPQEFVDTFNYSMSLLNLDYVDLFAMHGVNNAECHEHAKVCMDHALQWKKEGRIRNLGFSTHDNCAGIIKSIELDTFDYVNLHWYYIFQDNWPAILEANKRDMGVFIISPNEKGGLLFKESDKLRELCAPLHPMVFNGLFCLSRPEVHTLSCGASKPSDFEIHLETAELSDQAAGVAGPIEARLDEEMDRVLGKEWVEFWDEGLPEWHETPGELNIPWILRLRNLALAFDMIEFGKMRYNLFGSGGHWFPGKQVEDLEALDLSECLKNSPYRDQIPAMIAETHAMLVGEKRKRLQAE